MRRQLQRRPHVPLPGTDRRARVRVAVSGACVSFLVRACAGAWMLCVVVVVFTQRRQGRARGRLGMLRRGWLRRRRRTLDLASIYK